MRADEFASATEPHRRELLAHCYRMLGSVDDAEDLVQETYLRAWRSAGTYEGRASIRVWLYRIATNACLNELERGGPRQFQPFPETLARPQIEEPEAVAVAHESLRLALIAGLQLLPARQRAVLILRDVLAFPAEQVAGMLAISVPAVKSLLQRARLRLSESAPTPEGIVEPADPRARALLADYIAGFERYDLAALERALRTDAAIDLVDSATSVTGCADCLKFLSTVISRPGRWQMAPTVANGQPAAVAYDGGRAFGVGVLTTTDRGIARITVFGGGPALVARFGLPPKLRS
jgi:RNA polymerase sigma-70 factor (ECF subfamily)